MKALLFGVCMLIPVLVAPLQASEAEPELPKATGGWPMVLLAEPCHLGDQVMNDMKQPKPTGREIRKKFVMDRGPHSLYAGVWLTSTIGPDHEDFKKGHYQIKLILNGKDVAILNKRLLRRRRPGEPQKIVVRIEARSLKRDVNELVIQAGAKGNNISECEVHKIVLSVTRP